jgi:hypothetical protein
VRQRPGYGEGLILLVRQDHKCVAIGEGHGKPAVFVDLG